MQWIKKTQLEWSQMTYQPFNGMNPLYCDRGMKKIRGVGGGEGKRFIKKLEQNEVHDCEDDSYLWPLDLNQTPKMIRWYFFRTLFISSPHLSFMFFFFDSSISSSSLLVQLLVRVYSPLPFLLSFFVSTQLKKFRQHHHLLCVRSHWSAQRQLCFFSLLHSIIVFSLLTFYCDACFFHPVFFLSFSILAASPLLATLFPHASRPYFLSAHLQRLAVLWLAC